MHHFQVSLSINVSARPYTKQVCAQLNASREKAVAARATTGAGKQQMDAAMVGWCGLGWCNLNLG